jgi:hypothetical protein
MLNFKFFITLLIFQSFSLIAEDLFISEVKQLELIENSGFSFTEQIGSERSLQRLDQLYLKNSAYRVLADTLTADLKKMQEENRYKQVGPSMKYPYRLFHAGWLKSSKSFFELAGVIKREDKAFRHNNSCGDVRLIYRLTYKDETINQYSRLPMTVMFVRKVDGACAPNTAISDLLKKSTLHDIELNFQSLRWPSSMRPDMGGYAEYIMRVFEFKNGKLVVKVLDNTIDLTKLRQNPKLKEELLSLLKTPEILKKVDNGSLILEEKFLTKSAVSVAVHGLNRLANRSFDQVFTEADFKNLDYKDLAHVKSPKAYLRKLNESTCLGCHQSRSIAGFHFLGEDRDSAIEFNTIKIPMSDHFIRDQERRKSYLPGPKNPNMGFADRGAQTKGKKNERCYVGNDPSFKNWICQNGLKCEPVGAIPGKEYFGLCQEEKNALAGDACYFGRVSQSRNAKQDKETEIVDKGCKNEFGCLRPSDGYPGGYCFANYCDPKLRSCAALAVDGFNPCLAKGKPFKECLEKFTGSIEAGSCDRENPCRDDFICAVGFGKKGVCAPPYSLFQLRVDGHPIP